MIDCLVTLINGMETSDNMNKRKCAGKWCAEDAEIKKKTVRRDGNVFE